MIYLIILGYFVVAAIFYGFNLGHWQRNWSSIANECLSSDRRISMVFAIIWPVAIPSFVVSVLISNLMDRDVKFRKPMWW